MNAFRPLSNKFLPVLRMLLLFLAVVFLTNGILPSELIWTSSPEWELVAECETEEKSETNDEQPHFFVPIFSFPQQKFSSPEYLIDLKSKWPTDHCFIVTPPPERS